MMLSVHPDLVRLDRARPGHTDVLENVIVAIRADGVRSVSETGTLGDPTRASAEPGERYFGAAVDLVLGQVAGGSSLRPRANSAP